MLSGRWDEAVDREPILIRISAAKNLRDKTERNAINAGERSSNRPKGQRDSNFQFEQRSVTKSKELSWCKASKG